MDWKTILVSDDESFEGFPETDVVEYLVRLTISNTQLASD
jgi:hypothetical protein